MLRHDGGDAFCAHEKRRVAAEMQIGLTESLVVGKELRSISKKSRVRWSLIKKKEKRNTDRRRNIDEK